MKKKLFLPFLASVCALVCIFALSACGKSQSGNTVSETEWSNIFGGTFNKFTMSYTLTDENGVDSAPVVYKFDFVNKYFYMSYLEKETVYQVIYTDEGNNKGYNYAIWSGQTEWVRGSFVIDNDTGFMFDSQNEYYGFISLLKDKFSKFSYDEASGKYVCGTLKINDEMGTAEKVYVSIENGTLKSAEFENVVNSMMECSYVFTFDNFEIEIPEHFSEDL